MTVPCGKVIWQVNLNGTPDKAVLDEEGNIYILNRASVTTGMITKIKFDGQEIKEYKLNDGFRANDMVVSSQEEIFLTGFDNEHALTVKLNKEGIIVCSRRFEATCAEEVLNTALALDADGNVLVTGNDKYGSSNIAGCKIHLLKYASENGNSIWEKLYDMGETSAYFDNPSKILVGPSGIYITGTRQSCCIGHSTIFRIRTDKQGNLLWRRGAQASFTDEHFFVNAVLDAEENIIVIGQAYINRIGKATIFTAKTSTAGEQLWWDSYEPVSSYSYNPGSVVALDNNLIAVSASASNSSSNSHLVLLIFDQEGNRVMVDNIQPTVNTSFSNVTDLVSDEDGNLYMAGSILSGGNVENSQLMLLKYSATSTCPVQAVDVKLYLPSKPIRVGSQVRTTADFGSFTDLQNAGVKWTWGDGSNSSISYTLPGSPRITGEHTYEQAGIYTIGLDFSESCLTPTSEDYKQQIVIYDPTAGFVSSIGKVNNGSTKLRHMEPAAESTVAFALAYPNGSAEKPVGALALFLNNEDWFYSKSMDWLVISNNRAVLQGCGSINGSGTYKYIATVEDGRGSGLNDPNDKMRIQVWSSGGTLVYDNYTTGTTDLDINQPLPQINRGQVLINAVPSAVAALQIQEVMEKASSLPELNHEVTIYPNPFSSTATISFTPATQGRYKVLLYDYNGALVKEVANGEADAGKFIPIEIDGSSLSQGIYFAKLITPDSVKTIKLMLRH